MSTGASAAALALLTSLALVAVLTTVADAAGVMELPAIPDVLAVARAVSS